MRNTRPKLTGRNAEPEFDIETCQTLMFGRDELPLHDSEWQRLAEIMSASDFQHVIGGDSNESHSVWVSRYYNDVVSPQALSEFSDEIESIVMSKRMRRFYRRFTGTETLCLRRCQANLLNEGDYIGEHCDQDSSPDYYATVVFHFDMDYQGGDFETLQDGEVEHSYHPQAHTALVNNCRVPHRVTPVTRGQRLTLACFLSRSFQPNASKPADFRVDGQRRFTAGHGR